MNFGKWSRREYPCSHICGSRGLVFCPLFYFYRQFRKQSLHLGSGLTGKFDVVDNDQTSIRALSPSWGNLSEQGYENGSFAWSCGLEWQDSSITERTHVVAKNSPETRQFDAHLPPMFLNRPADMIPGKAEEWLVQIVHCRHSDGREVHDKYESPKAQELSKSS